MVNLKNQLCRVRCDMRFADAHGNEDFDDLMTLQQVGVDGTENVLLVETDFELAEVSECTIYDVPRQCGDITTFKSFLFGI